jgi:hypothetical protein
MIQHPPERRLEEIVQDIIDGPIHVFSLDLLSLAATAAIYNKSDFSFNEQEFR